MPIIHNRLDQFLFFLLSFLLVLMYLLWYFVNIFPIYYRFLWFAIIPLAACSAYVLGKQYNFTLAVPGKKSILYPYLLFFLLLAGVLLYYVEPILRYPTATIGIPNKHVHDALAVFISAYGHPPSLTSAPATTEFIIDTNNGLYLGYPNVLHTLSALLIQLGIARFHATYLGALIGLLSTSIALFLLIKYLFKDNYMAAILASLFAVSSFRLPLAMVASLPMLFSYALIVPALVAVIVAIRQSKNFLGWILPTVAIALVAAAYSGTIVIFLGLLVTLALFLFVGGEKTALLRLSKLLLFSLPLLALTLFFQQPIYWRNTFPTAADFDPYELSQRIAPLDKPLYMLILFASLVVVAISLIKRRLAHHNKPLLYTLLLAIPVFLLFIPYDLIFHYLSGTGEQALVNVNPNGLFGGLTHQKVSRLALLQPFVFIFFLGEVFMRLKYPAFRIGALVGFLLLNFVVRFDLPLYNPVQHEVATSFYNQKDLAKPYTLLSHVRLVVNDQIWTAEIVESLNYLQRLAPAKYKVVLVDGRGWTEETIANWGSVKLKQRIYRRKDLSPAANSNSTLLTYLRQEQYNYLLLIQPDRSLLVQIKSHPSSRLSYHNQDVYLYQINSVVLQ